MKTLRISIALLLLASATACSGTKNAGVSGDWQVMVEHSGRPTQLCYAGSEPISSSGTLEKRTTTPYLMITRRPSGKIEVSMSSGYVYMHGSRLVLSIDGKTYRLFYKKDVAWAKGDMRDKVIIDALKKAQNIELRGVSEDGGTSIDHYSSDGFAAALARVRKLCP